MTNRYAPVTVFFCLLFVLPAAPAAARNEDWRGYPAEEWPLAGGHFGQTRHSALAQITPDNLDRLGGAWVTELGRGEVSRSTVVVRNGLLFLNTGQSIRALDAATGEERWRRDAPVGRMNKGVALGSGLVFAGLSDSRLIALDQQTGELVWEHLVGVEGQVGQWISSPSTYAQGLVITGMANGDSYLRGRVVAVDALTSERRWLFDIIPEPGAIGSDTWPVDSDVWRFGGGGVWMTPTIDVDLGLFFVGSGNAVPMWGGELRPGDNLFTSSVVALDLHTGEYRWHRQLVHHELWEHDLATPLIVYDTTVDGEPRRALAAMRTDGYLFMLDAATGEPVFPIEERPVPQNEFLRTSPTQPFPVGADKVGSDCVDPDMIPPGFEAGCYYDPIGPDLPNKFIPYMTMRFAPMAFKLGGTVPERPAPEPPPTVLPFQGPVVDTDAIELKRIIRQSNENTGRNDEWHDPYGLTPTRAAAAAGTQVTWTNPTDLTHTIAARDGSWSTGPIAPGGSGAVMLDAAGEHEYICTEHPWTIGQLVVE